MNEWIAFIQVAVVTLVSACVLVFFFALGLRLLTTAGRIPMVEPAEFTGAITILTPARAAKEAKRARKAAAANPLTDSQKRVAVIGAYLCFAVCGAAVLYGIYLIVPALHGS
ncbi:peptidase [Leifsonia sp. YAF41]|uniref:peptidase n=1 Tax=Leifsonia sp. YAF41 TaxID=3233086 RepID=UPI003F966063